MKRVLVTGANGFVGRSIFDYLNNHTSFEVFSLNDSNAADDYINLASLASITQIRNKFTSLDCVVHCAANLSLQLNSPDVSSVNCFGTENVLEAALQCNAKRVVNLSSIPVIGFPQYFPIDELHPANPTTKYHCTKLYAEKLMTIYSEKTRMTTISLRISAPVGIHMPRSRFLSVLIDSCLTDNPVRLMGTGERIQDYIDVRDIANSVYLSINSDVTGVYNIASSSPISNKDLAHKVRDLLNSKSIIYASSEKSHADREVWDITCAKAFSELGFLPTHTIDDTVMDMVASRSD